MQWKR